MRQLIGLVTLGISCTSCCRSDRTTMRVSPGLPIQKLCNEEDAAIRAKLEDALKSTKMLNIEKQLLELQFEDERRRQEWMSQRGQLERDELHTELREMLSGQQDERAEGPLATVPLDPSCDANGNDSHRQANSMLIPSEDYTGDVVPILTVLGR